MKELAQACLMDQPHSNDQGQTMSWVEHWARPLSKDAASVLEVISKLSTEAEKPADPYLSLLSRTFDEARMHRENNEPGAVGFFARIEDGLTAMTTAGSLGSNLRFGLSQAYLRAALTPPDVLRVTPDALDALDETQMPDLPDLTQLMDDLALQGSTPFETYNSLREILGTMPADTTSEFLSEMIAQGEPRIVAMGRYFLLDPMEDLRQAAIAGFEQLVTRGGSIKAALLSELILIRNWIPEGKVLDPTIKAALKSEPTGGILPQPWQMHKVLSSLPDGTGSQSIMVVCSRGKSRAIAALMIKDGFGLKDAYVIPCASRNEQRDIQEQVEASVTMQEISADYLEPALGHALGNGLACGEMPAVGLLDIAPMLGLDELKPKPGTLAELLATADPKGELAELSDNRRGRLIAESRDWFERHDMAESWFISDQALMADLEEATSLASARKVVAKNLDAGRTFWARQFARCATILQASSDDVAKDAQSFAAVAHALEAGRPLKKIPVFDDILEQTLDSAVAHVREHDEADLDNDEFEIPDIRAEGKGELARLLKGSELSPDQIDGYLTSVLIAPEFSSPTEWLQPLLGGIEIQGEGNLQRVLDISMQRYSMIDDAILEKVIGILLQKLSKKRFQEWAKGFAQGADGVDGAWPKRKLTRDDKQVLDLIRRAQNEDLSETLKPLLPSWLNVMAQKWRYED